MNTFLNNNIYINQNGDDIPSAEVLNNQHHFLEASVNVENKDIQLSFSSRLAMYEFAKSLLHESIYGENSQIEFYPLGFEGKLLVVDGVRLSLNSSRIFVNYKS